MQQGSKLRPPPIDVITIQSQVVYGSVGNGIAYRTLLKKNLEVLQVPSVLFGCPPYYGAPHGGSDLQRMVQRFSGRSDRP
ncbi:Pyridoxine kinase [Serratia fonticola]|uniref:Pyridoxine kinase n=1 Tax=Serratia fonticola TaxID=47917 RepID=A0A4U9W509_SERFO|nr:Pyridoxine kinase [Serratia fonticola]